MKDNKQGGSAIGIRSFLTAIGVIFALMVATYILTLLIPGGYIPFWQWAASPFLVLGSEGSGSLIAVIAFLLVIGGIFNSLDQCGLMKYMLDRTVHRFGRVRYRLMAIILLFFMGMGTMIGSFEECVPLVPIVVALSVNLGWDALTGVAMSLLAAGCGFAAGVCNPFTVGVAQQLAGLPVFSGVWMRLLAFALIYGLLFVFVRLYAKKIERPLDDTAQLTFERNRNMDRGLICFASILGLGILTIFCSGFITALQDLTMIIVAVMFLLAGITATLVSGMSVGKLGSTAFQGVVNILPAVLMILMASSIKYTLEQAQVLDTMLDGAVGLAQTLPNWVVILFIYLIVLVMNFFIPSGSAKAFMLMPLIVPLAKVFGISPQLCVLAFAFGDGFSNVFYPTNPALLISLGLAKVSYGQWAKWSFKFQLCNLLLTGLLLLFGLAVGY